MSRTQHRAALIALLCFVVAASAPASPSGLLIPRDDAPAIAAQVAPGPTRLTRRPPEDDWPVARVASRFGHRVLSAHSYFAGAQIVSFYGYPGFPTMGVLGAYPLERVAGEVERVAARYDALNGEQRVIPALHLIVAVAQTQPQHDGSYLARLEPAVLDQYVELARARGLLLFLDVQVGWADPLAEVQLLERALREPFVHLALDPEFATRQQRAAPGTVIGRLHAAEINLVQQYLARLVTEYGLAPKIFVLHQFTDEMLQDAGGYEPFDEVELTIDMDGYGSEHAKLANYDRYALADYSERPALKLFYDWDVPLMTPERVQGLERPPALVIYQ